MKLLVTILIIIGSFCNAEQYYRWTSCKDHKQCDQECHKQKDTSSRTCDKTGKYERCVINMIYSCECSCITDCNFDDIVNSKLSVCGEGGEGIDKLESVDEEILEQIIFNVNSVILGSVPGLGTVFDIGFAAWDPVSPITSSFSLANDIRKVMNTVIIQLQQCMDDKITEAKVDTYSETTNALLNYYQFTVTAEGDVKIDRMTESYSEFTLALNEMFYESTDDDYLGIPYLEYFGMLPIYQSLYPLYVTVATERLIYLKYNQSDCANFKNEFSEVMGVLTALETWIYWARESVRGNLYDKLELEEPCRNINDIASSILEWMDDFTETYITNLLDVTAEIMKLDVGCPKLCQIRFKLGNFVVDDDKHMQAMTTSEELANGNNYNSYWYHIQKSNGDIQLQNRDTNRYLVGTVRSGNYPQYISTSESAADSWWKLVQIPNSDHEDGYITALFNIERDDYICELFYMGYPDYKLTGYTELYTGFTQFGCEHDLEFVYV